LDDEDQWREAVWVTKVSGGNLCGSFIFGWSKNELMQSKPLLVDLPPDLCPSEKGKVLFVCCAKKNCCKKYKKGKPCKKCPKKRDD
jgi:hypothetical protein